VLDLEYWVENSQDVEEFRAFSKERTTDFSSKLKKILARRCRASHKPVSFFSPVQHSENFALGASCLALLDKLTKNMHQMSVSFDKKHIIFYI